MSEALVHEIQSKGYWRVLIRPETYAENRIPTLSACKELLTEMQVRLRGWYFPHFRREDLVNRSSWVECGTHWHVVREYWRFYQSGQFIHVSGCAEDYSDQAKLARTSRFVSRLSASEEHRYLDILSVIYRFTEIFEFASRMARKEILGKGGLISVELRGAGNRVLTFYDPMRHLSMPYVSKSEVIQYSRSHSAENLLASAPELALDAIKYFFEHFNWDHMPVQVFQDEQEKVLTT